MSMSCSNLQTGLAISLIHEVLVKWQTYSYSSMSGKSRPITSSYKLKKAPVKTPAIETNSFPVPCFNGIYTQQCIEHRPIAVIVTTGFRVGTPNYMYSLIASIPMVIHDTK